MEIFHGKIIHVKTVEKKFSKNIDLIYCAKQVLDKDSLSSIYFPILTLC